VYTGVQCNFIYNTEKSRDKQNGPLTGKCPKTGWNMPSSKKSKWKGVCNILLSEEEKTPTCRIVSCKVCSYFSKAMRFN
jgi:hypothetical protein